MDSGQVAGFAQVGFESFECCQRLAAPVRDVLHLLYGAHGNLFLALHRDLGYTPRSQAIWACGLSV